MFNKIRERFRWQNLNELPDNKLGPPVEGRCWFRINDNTHLHLEWNFKTHFCHLYTELCGGDDEVFTYSVAFPPVALWFGLENYHIQNFINSKIFKGQYGGKELGVRFFDNSLHWDVFSQSHYWSNSVPKWQDGSFNFADFFLGKMKYSTETIQEKEVEVPLPEKNYKAKVKMFVSYWKRPRWFTQSLLRANVDMIEPIPIPGKGTCSYNCADDHTYSITVEARNPEDAIGKLVGDVLETRRKRGWV